MTEYHLDFKAGKNCLMEFMILSFLPDMILFLQMTRRLINVIPRKPEITPVH